jgi:hypothetical protein
VNNLAGGVFNLNTNGQLFHGFSSDEEPHRFNNQAGASLRYAPGVVVDFHRWEWWHAGEARASNTATISFWVMNAISGATFRGEGTQTLNGHITLSGPILADETTVVFNSSMEGASTNAYLLATNGGEFEWRAGTLYGTLNIGSNTVFRATGEVDYSHSISRTEEKETTINNHGHFILDGSRIFLEQSWAASAPPISWTNRPGSVFEISRDGDVFFNVDSPTHFSQFPRLHNGAGAIFTKSGGAGTTTVSGLDFYNFGTVGAESGVAEFVGRVRFYDGSRIGGDAEVRVTGIAALYGRTTVDGGVFALSGTTTGGLGSANKLGVLATTNTGVFEWRQGYLGGVMTFAPGSVTRVVTDGLKMITADPGDKAIINNAGTWFWESSSWLDAWVPASFNNLASGVFNVVSNCSLVDSTWQWACGFTNGGTVNLFPGRGLGSWWNLHFLPSSRVNLLLGSEADRQRRIDAPNRDMELNGALMVSLTNGFVPAPGAVFTVAKYRERHGEFSTTAFPALPAGQHWRLDYGELPTGTNNHTISLSVERTALTPGSSTNGQYQFSFSGPPSNRCVVDATDDLEEWTPIYTNAPFTGTLLFADPDAVNHPKRFYRVRLE